MITNNPIDFAKFNINNKHTRKKQDVINSIVSEFYDSESLYDFFVKINQRAGIKKLKPGHYSYGNYRLILGSKINLEDTGENLEFINKYDIGCAPRLAQIITNKNDKYQMLILCMPETLPYLGNENKVSAYQRAKLFSDLSQFSKKTGLYNPNALEEGNWLITKNGDIIIADWSEINEFNSSDEYSKFHYLLAKKTGMIFY